MLSEVAEERRGASPGSDAQSQRVRLPQLERRLVGVQSPAQSIARGQVGGRSVAIKALALY